MQAGLTSSKPPGPAVPGADPAAVPGLNGLVARLTPSSASGAMTCKNDGVHRNVSNACDETTDSSHSYTEKTNGSNGKPEDRYNEDLTTVLDSRANTGQAHYNAQ
jgi:hypothetical protein